MCAAAGLISATAAVAPAAATDLEALRKGAQEIADQVTSLEHSLESLQSRRKSLDNEIQSASRDIGLLELEMNEAEARVERAGDRYVARAVEAYKNGPTARLGLLLSADDVSDMISIAEATLETARADTEALEHLEAARAEIEAAGARVEERKARLLTASAEAEEVASGITSTLSERRSALSELSAKIDELERRARREAQASANRVESTDSVAQEETSEPQPPADDQSVGALHRVGEFITTGVTFEGLASWYGPGFEGQTTANGDIFHAAGLTAASRDLPLGTWLRVGRAGASVIVEVNDRGPYIEERVLDLSQGAAGRLGITGVEWVTAEILLPR